MKQRIFQVLDAIMFGDAVSNEVIAIDIFLQQQGYTTGIYTLWTDETVQKKRKDFYTIPNIRPDDVILFHFSGYSHLIERIKHLPCTKILRYHNITPSFYFQHFSETNYQHCKKGEDQIKTLTPYVDVVWGCSKFSSDTLLSFGYKNVTTVPILFSEESLKKCPIHTPTIKKYRDTKTNILFVGRFAPNKKQEDIIKAFYLYKTYYNPHARLFLIGNTKHTPLYTTGILTLIADLKLTEDVIMDTHCPKNILRSYYEQANMFLCLTEHEGFCVPLIEAMVCHIPLIAFASSAVEETIGKKHPCLLPTKDYTTIVSMMHRLVTNKQFRKNILQYQKKQVQQFSFQRVKNTFLKRLRDVSIKHAFQERMPKDSFSIVINTYNRYEYLKKALVHIYQLNYPSYEVIIVNGPSTDDTYKIKELFPLIQYYEIQERNLSISRNVGISAAKGDYIAFIDDDAYPDKQWLQQLFSMYQHDIHIGGVGGRVFGPGNDHFQFEFGFIDRFGNPTAHAKKDQNYNHPQGKYFNIMMGTNCSFRRDVLYQVGGFDERYEYYHDESDLCVRIIQAGYHITNHPEAFIHHEFAKSHIRNTIRDINWTVIVKNHTYFAFRHSSKNILINGGKIFYYAFYKRVLDFICWYRKGEIPLYQTILFSIKSFIGLLQGYYKGIACAPLLPFMQKKNL